MKWDSSLLELVKLVHASPVVSRADSSYARTCFDDGPVAVAVAAGAAGAGKQFEASAALIAAARIAAVAVSRSWTDP